MSCLLQILFPQRLTRKIMKKLFTLVAIAGLAFSTIGCAQSEPPAPTPPAVTDTPATDNTPAPADPAPPVEEKK
jgi:hypothetical protein